MKSRFNDKHLKALELIKDNKLSVKEIADQVGFHSRHLYQLMRGDAKTGLIGQLFAEELGKIDKVVQQRTDRKMLQARELLYDRLLTWSKTVQQVDSTTKHRMMIDSINALSKAFTQINIQSYTWKSGMTQEEALNEFRRLTAMAKQATIRSRVSKPKSRGTKQIPLSDRQVNSLPEDPQDPILRAEPEAEDLPREQGPDQGDIRGE